MYRVLYSCFSALLRHSLIGISQYVYAVRGQLGYLPRVRPWPLSLIDVLSHRGLVSLLHLCSLLYYVIRSDAAFSWALYR